MPCDAIRTLSSFAAYGRVAAALCFHRYIISATPCGFSKLDPNGFLGDFADLAIGCMHDNAER
jgi:hypothetical protein